MLTLLARNWGWVLLRGVAALIFGLLALFNPGITLVVLVILFGSYAIVDGIFTIISAIANRQGEPHWVALLINGLVSLAIGIVTFLWPGITALALLFLIAAWAVITYARGIVFDFPALFRTVTLALVIAMLFTRSRRLEWFAALVILVLGAARLSTQVVR